MIGTCTWVWLIYFNHFTATLDGFSVYSNRRSQCIIIATLSTSNVSQVHAYIFQSYPISYTSTEIDWTIKQLLIEVIENQLNIYVFVICCFPLYICFSVCFVCDLIFEQIKCMYALDRPHKYLTPHSSCPLFALPNIWLAFWIIIDIRIATH